MSFIKKELADLLANESFVRWVNGNATRSEEEKWNNWLKEDPLHQEIKTKAEKMYDYRWELDNAGDLESQLDKLIDRIDKDSVSEVGYSDKKARKSGQRLRGRKYKLAVAAVIVFLLAAVCVLTLDKWQGPSIKGSTPLYTTIKVDSGEKKSLNISDGSHIQLNSGSSLRYSPEQFNSNQVEVWLKGEGYFNISNNPNGLSRQFIVHTPHGDVSVLGTKFNVNTNLKTSSIVLEKGKVKVSFHDSSTNKKVERTMHPGERAIISESPQEILLQKVDANLFTSWLEGKMLLSNTPLEKIIEAIEAKYRISLDVVDPSVLDKQMTGSIQNPDLASLLTSLEELLDTKIKKKGEKMYLITQKSLH